jgi:hypothetical protein
LLQFDATVTPGNILELVTLIGVASVAYWRLGALEKKVDGLKDVMTTIARQDERLRHLEAEVWDLRHAKGLDPITGARFPRVGHPPGE